MLVVEREAECRPSRHAGADRVVAVATRENELRELVEPARGGPVAAGVEVGVHEEDVELRLVLDGALEPAVLVLEVLGRIWDELACDLSGREDVDQHGERGERTRQRKSKGAYLANLDGELGAGDDGGKNGDDRHGVLCGSA